MSHSHSGAVAGSRHAGQAPAFAPVGVRIAAALIDVLLTVVFVLLLTPGWGLTVSATVVPAAYWVLSIVTTATLGGEPGKLVVGLRITEADGVTSPPHLKPSILRTLPRLVGSVPGAGPLLGFALGAANIVLVRNDAERRSVHDRFGQTRVIRRSTHN